VSTIYDFEYASFEVNILSKFIDWNGTLDMRRAKEKMLMLDNDKMTKSVSLPNRKKADNSI